MILLFCGIPAAGKTSLAGRFQSWLQQQQPQRQQQEDTMTAPPPPPPIVRYIDFDAIEASLSDEQGDGDDADAGAGAEDADSSSSIKRWHQARTLALAEAEDFLTTEREKREAGGASNRLLVILDDNMYYTSMRREVYKIAAGHEVGYGCIYVDVPLEVALRRNQARARVTITKETIERMHAKMEPPDPSVHTWEANSLRLDNADTGDDEKQHDDDDDEEEANNASILRQIMTVVEKGWATPAVVPQQELSAEEIAAKEEARRQTRENQLHATDLCLRKIVGTIMRMASTAKASDEEIGFGAAVVATAASLGPKLSQAKAQLMKEIKEDKREMLLTVNPLLSESEQAHVAHALTRRLFAVLREQQGSEKEGEGKEWVIHDEWEQQTLEALNL